MKQTVLPRQDPGMDWGARRRLVAATPDKSALLFIRESHSMGMGARGFGQTYVPTALILWRRDGSQHGHWRGLAEGRIGKRSIEENKDVIDRVFGVGVWRHLDPRKTMWITPAGVVELTDRGLNES